MRISFAYLLILSFSLGTCLAVTVNAQEALKAKVGGDFKNASLEQVLKQLGKSAQVKFVYSDAVVNHKPLVSTSFEDITLADALNTILGTRNIRYEVFDEKFIVLKPKVENNHSLQKNREEVLDETSAKFGLVSGTVVDELGKPIPGVSVRVKDGAEVTATRTNGYFALNIAAPNSIVIFSYIGYKTKELPAALDMKVALEPDLAKLDEVVVMGYGTTTRRISTGSQTGISAKEIENQPVTNVLQAMQGRLPGVAITQTNGLPGAGINVQIRGANGIDKRNRPLYIIDGVPYLSEQINLAASGDGTGLPSAEGQTSPLNTLNPADIESIEVLKDADATSIYGSRAANGVVLITTKKGKSGKTRVGINASTGAAVVANFLDMMQIDQYLALRRKGFENVTTSPAAPNATNAPDLTLWSQTQNTDWQRELLGGTARTHDLNANFSGGDARTNFYVSGTYHREGNVYPGDQGYQRGGVNVNLSHSSADQRFTMGISAIYSADKNDISTTDLATYAYNLPPNFPLYNPDGSLYWVSGQNNPLGFLNQTNDNRTSNLLSNLNLKYNIAKGLDIKTSLGYSKTDSKQVTIRPLSSLNTSLSVPNSGTASYAYTNTNNLIVEPQLTYNTKVWKGTLNLLAGGTYQYRNSEQPYSSNASGFSSDDFLRNLSAATTVSIRSSSREFKYASLFARANYNIDNKYILNLNFRRDGSSRFGPNNRFGNFGSVGAAWIFSEEQFIKNKLSWLSFGKLRGSYGTVGSDEIGDYAYLGTYTTFSGVLYNGNSSLNPSRIENKDYQWEETRKFEVGFELGFFKDRLSLVASYYRNRSGNQLITYPLSPQAGFSGYQSNLGAVVQNAGLELSLIGTIVKKKDFTWTGTFNISRNDNKLLSFPDIEKTSYYNSYLVGKPINFISVFQYIGIDPNTNLPAYANLDGLGSTATPTIGLSEVGRGDRYYVGTTNPKFFGGIGNTLSYKGITLDFMFQFVRQQGRSLATSSFYPPGYMYNSPTSVVNEYLALGSQDYLVTAGTGGVNGRAAYFAYNSWISSDATVVDASFIRLKNVNLSYKLPSSWLSKINVENVRIFTQAQNLFTITGYKGFDPESQGRSTPPLRAIVAGLQFTF